MIQPDWEGKGGTYSKSGQNVGPRSNAHSNNTLQPAVKHNRELLGQQVRKTLKYEGKESVWKLELNLPKVLQHQWQGLSDLVHGWVLISGKQHLKIKS